MTVKKSQINATFVMLISGLLPKILSNCQKNICTFSIQNVDINAALKEMVYTFTVLKLVIHV